AGADQRVVGVAVVHELGALAQVFGRVLCQAVAKSITGVPTIARTWQSAAVAATTSGKKYWSLKQVTPESSISAIAWRVPSRTISALAQRFSFGQMPSASQRSSGRSSATPRNTVIAAWVC